jgi:hypothetical protein
LRNNNNNNNNNVLYYTTIANGTNGVIVKNAVGIRRGAKGSCQGLEDYKLARRHLSNGIRAAVSAGIIPLRPHICTL